MIFEPYDDELEFIHKIHKYNDADYSIIRLTDTMIGKNNPDANFLLRDLLEQNGLINYEKIENGGKNGIHLIADFLFNDKSKECELNFYRVQGKGGRADRRFSIYGIKNLAAKQLANTGDLLYFTINNNNGKKITIINVTKNQPTEFLLASVFGQDKVEESLTRLIPKMKTIAANGFQPSMNNASKNFPRLAGDTLEYLLGIRANNSQHADFEETIELKSKTQKTMDTLFTLRPHFEGTPVADFEPKDRSRVSAFARLYGYNSEAHIGFRSLYITIGSEKFHQNSYGFYLNVNEENREIELKKQSTSGEDVVTAFWTFDELESELHQKHKATLWVDAEVKIINNVVNFRYKSAELSRSPQFATFLALIKTGIITYDWRGYTTPDGPYKGKNHGNAWRIKNKHRGMLFGSMEKINLI